MKITANMVTIARIVLMPIPGCMLYLDSGWLIFALAIISVLGITDYIDGIMARREGPTTLGGLLDPIADKIFIAVIYLPLTVRYVPEWNRMVIPLWITVLIFVRDFLVTSLRTSLSLRDAPMRTSTLAKFKTAIQMVGSGYILFLLIVQMRDPETWLTWPFLCGPILIPLSLIIYRLITGKKQGRRSMTMFSLMTVAVIIRYFLGADITSLAILAGITSLTVVSGFSYLADAWSALKGKKGGVSELFRFVTEGFLVPVSFLIVLGRYDTPGTSALIIVSFTLELAGGGLQNLLASQKIKPRFGLTSVKSALQIFFTGSSFVMWFFDIGGAFHLGEISIACAAIVTVAFSALSFFRHRKRYLSQI